MSKKKRLIKLDRIEERSLGNDRCWNCHFLILKRKISFLSIEFIVQVNKISEDHVGQVFANCLTP